MVEPAHARQTYNFTVTCFPSLDRPLVRRVFPQSIMNPILMIVAQVLTNQSSQVAFVDHDHLIEQFPPAAPHPSFRHPILPRTLIGCPNQFATQGLEHLCRFSLVLPVSIQDQIARRGVIRKSLSQLLPDPTAGWMFRGVKVEDSPAVVADHEEAVQDPKRRGRDCEEVHGRNHFSMVLQKVQPEFASISVTACSKKVSGDGTLGNLKAKFQEFSMNPGTSPGGILLHHPFDKLTKLGANPGSTALLSAGK